MFAVAARSRTAAALRVVRPKTQQATSTKLVKRNMGGGKFMYVSQPHTIAGEICGFFTWLWVFHRARLDGPVVLGLRHPWEHAEDPWAVKDHVDNLDGLRNDWEAFSEKSSNPGDDDDEDEDDDDEDDDDDDE